MNNGLYYIQDNKIYRMSLNGPRKNPGLYSLSTYEKPTDVKRFAGVMSDMQVSF